MPAHGEYSSSVFAPSWICLLYTSDAADDSLRVIYDTYADRERRAGPREIGFASKSYVLRDRMLLILVFLIGSTMSSILKHLAHRLEVEGMPIVHIAPTGKIHLLRLLKRYTVGEKLDEGKT